MSKTLDDYVAEQERFSDRITAPLHEEIAALAYQLWIARGREDGAAQEDWFEAERELGVVNGQRTTS